MAVPILTTQIIAIETVNDDSSIASYVFIPPQCKENSFDNINSKQNKKTMTC